MYGDIVVCLPLHLSVAVSMQYQLLQYLDYHTNNSYTIKIKPHPYLPKSARLERLFSSYKNCNFVENDVESLFNECALVIAPASSVVYEALFLGIKTLLFIPEEFTVNVTYFLKDYLFIAYEYNFSERVEEALKSRNYPRLNITEYFSKPDYDLFLKNICTYS